MDEAHKSSSTASDPRPTLLRLLREPLLHFVAMGLVIVGISNFFRPGGQSDLANEIRVDGPALDRVADAWTRQNGTRPSSTETDRLIDEHVHNEVLFREALARGLFRDDPVVRRRLIQLMEFNAKAEADFPEPTDAELDELRLADPRLFSAPGTFTFEHVFIGNPNAAERAAELLERIRGGESTRDLAQMSDPIRLPLEFDGLRANQAAVIFGESFARLLEELELDTWSGPVESDHGLHLVRILNRSVSRPLPLEEVRESVRAEWLARREHRVVEEYAQALRRRYQVVVESRPGERPSGPDADSGERP